MTTHGLLTQVTAYDDADRLVDASYANGDRYQYAYDAVGNRLAYSVTTQALLTGTTTYAYDDADRLTYVDTAPISYDNRGNQLGDGVWTYTYDAAGRMVRAETITSTQVYTYGGDGLLVAQNLDGVETAFTWDQCCVPQVLTETVAPPGASRGSRSCREAPAGPRPAAGIGHLEWRGQPLRPGAPRCRAGRRLVLPPARRHRLGAAVDGRARCCGGHAGLQPVRRAAGAAGCAVGVHGRVAGPGGVG